MYYGFIILGLMVICLVVYFIFERKLKMPTVVTSILINQYNKKLKHVARFLKKNQIAFEEEKYKSGIQKENISKENLIENIKTIKKIKENAEIFEKILKATARADVDELLSQLNEKCQLFEFKEEFVAKDKNNDILEMFNIEKGRLGFEYQKYFGSQDFFFVENKCVLLDNFSAFIIDQKNIFDCNYLTYNLKINKKSLKNDKKSENNEPIYEILFKSEGFEFARQVKVIQPHLQKFLNKKIKNEE